MCLLCRSAVQVMYKLNFGSPRSRPDASRTPETVCGHDHMTNVGSGRLQLHAPDPGPRRRRSFAVNRDVPAYKRPATPNAPLVLKPPPSPAPLSLACSAAARLPLRFKARTLGPRKVRPTCSVAGESMHAGICMIYARYMRIYSFHMTHTLYFSFGILLKSVMQELVNPYYCVKS